MSNWARDKRGIVVGEQFFCDLQHLAQAYREADKQLRPRITKRLRTIAKPFGQKILRDGADEFPRRGGLADRMRAGTATAAMSLGASTPSVAISLNAKSPTGQRMAVRSMDADGLVRHPVWPKPDQERKEWTWVAQRIRPHIFTDEFEKGADEIRDQVGGEIQAVLDDIAKA